MLKKFALGLVVLLIALAAFIATRPDSYTVSRSTVVPATPDVVFALVSDFHHFERFSPWADRDPNLTTTFDGPPTGVGATYAWKGNSDVGSGKMTVTAATTNKSVDIRLEFLEPFPSTATTRFELAPEGEGTQVTWSMQGNNNFMAKAFGLVFDMETYIGGDYEKGLARLAEAAAEETKVRAEAARKAAEEAAAAAAAVEAVPAEAEAAPAAQ